MLNKILTVPGVSGREEEAASLVAGLFEPYCDQVTIHRTHSVIGYKKATRSTGESAKRLMFAAHLDQIGLVITRIEKGGFLRITGIGYDPKVLPGQPVKIYGRRELFGVISVRSFSTLPLSEHEKSPPMDEIYIDTGLDEETVRSAVRVGDLAKIEMEPVELQGAFYSSPVLDDRACIAAMIIGMERLADLHHEWDLYFVATCGEESTGKGAMSAAWEIQPDAAVAMDVTFGTQPGVPDHDSAAVGKGLTLSLGPIFDQDYRRKMVDVCRREKIPMTDEPDMVGFGTDAASIRQTRGGVPVNLISLPIKSMHTPVEVMSLDDLEELGRFTAAFAASIHRELPAEESGEETC